MRWLNGYRASLVLAGVVTVILLSAANVWGAGFMDDFNRSDGEVGNGWLIWTDGGMEPRIVDNEVLIAGQQGRNWRRSGIYRPVEDETRFAFDFKADDQFNVHIELYDTENPDGIDFYAWPGGPFSYGWGSGDEWTGWIRIPGSDMITGQYNTLVVEQDGTEFTLTLNGKMIGTATKDNIIRIGEVFIGSDAAAGTVGSLHIDNVEIGNVVIGQVPIIPSFDFNGDGIVDVKDVVTLTDYWGQDYSVCDISPMPWGDGIVDVKDLLALATYLEQETALIAHWPFDETEGMVAADSAGENDAMVMGVPVWRPDGGTVNGALELTGTTFIMGGSILNPSDGPFSVLAWVKGGQPGQGIITQQGGVDWLMADAVDGKLATDLSHSLCSEAVITDGDWHRIGVTGDGSACLLYVDGVVEAQSVEDGLTGSAGKVIIGCRKTMTPGTFFTGLIDDVRIYNRVVKP